MVCVCDGCVKQQAEEEEHEDGTEIENWSSTHSVKTKAYLQPESVEEVRTLLCHDFVESAGPLLVTAKAPCARFLQPCDYSDDVRQHAVVSTFPPAWLCMPISYFRSTLHAVSHP